MSENFEWEESKIDDSSSTTLGEFQFLSLLLPTEFCKLLKDAHSGSLGHGSPVAETLRGSKSLSLILSRAFKEFDEHKLGLEKVLHSLGWSPFKERWASVYLFKILHGSYPEKTDLQLVQNIKLFEQHFLPIAHSSSNRLFLLGFYLEVLNLYRRNTRDLEPLIVPHTLFDFLHQAKVKTAEPDWLILLGWHFSSFLGEETLNQSLSEKKSFSTLYFMLTESQRFLMLSNLMAYGASIQESDPFLFNRV